MSFLPIVERELRVASRKPATFWVRVFLVLVTLIIWFLLMGQSQSSNASLGQMLFIAIGILALSFCLFAGVFLTADCLSEERREGTIGLLFLTDLKGYDVVLGKLVSNSLHAFYGLLAILPMLALPLLIGGVTAGEFWRITMALLVSLSLSLTLGLAASAFNHDPRRAISTALLLLIVPTGILPVVWMVQRYIIGGSGCGFLLWPSPVFLYSQALETNFGPSGAQPYYFSLATIIGLSVMALILTSWSLPRIWQETSRATGKTTGFNWTRFNFGSAAHRLMRRRLFLDDNPYYWLASRELLPGRTAALVMGACLPIWLCFLVGCFHPSRNTQNWCFGVVMFMAYGLHVAMKLMVTTEACRRLNEDRHSGALELVLSTPISVQNIIEGQRRALWETVRVPLLLLLGLNVILVWVVGLADPLRMNGDAGVFCVIYVGGAVLLLADYYALTWTGMRSALCKGRHTRAIFSTLMRVMLVPWVMVLMTFLVVTGRRGFSGNDVAGFFMFWALTAGVLDLMVATWAESNLNYELRKIASGSMQAVRESEFSSVSVLVKAEDAA